MVHSGQFLPALSVTENFQSAKHTWLNQVSPRLRRVAYETQQDTGSIYCPNACLFSFYGCKPLKGTTDPYKAHQ